MRNCSVVVKGERVQMFIVAGEPVNIYTVFFLPTTIMFTNHVAVPHNTVQRLQKKEA